MKTQDIESKKS